MLMNINSNRKHSLVAINITVYRTTAKLPPDNLQKNWKYPRELFVRDMEALSAAGVPVFAERGSNGGWCLSEGYRTTLTGMKTVEIISLLLSNPSNLLDDLGIRNDFDMAFLKLLAESPVTIQQDADIVRQRIHIDGAGWHQSNETFPYLTTVQYQREKDIVERIVNPLLLVAKRSIWYVLAEIEGEFRTYRVSRLVDAHLVEESFERPHNFNLAQYWE
jgi:predicted DNA-binding transcriptional regulator YafY